MVIVLCAVDLRSVIVADYPILVDRSPPIAGEVFDGDFLGHDIMFTKERKQVS